MDVILPGLPVALFAAAIAVAILAGVIKGMVGFAMPMVMISGLSTFLPPEIALAGLIMPTVFTNVWQALRQGWRAALESVMQFRVFLACLVVALLISAQFVSRLPPNVLLMFIGVPVTAFAVLQLAGVVFHAARNTPALQALVGTFAGLISGFSGIWGPPTVAYLTALGTEKREQMRIQGVIYGIGAVALVGAHTGSGILNAQTLPLSLSLVPPAILGMWVGGLIQDRIDQATFRRATLVVLVVAGLNLMRRALMI